MSEGEIWKDVVDYEGLYKVSNKGNVYSVGRVSSQGKKCGGLTLKPRSFRNGYLHVNLYKNGKMKSKSIHRLVAEVFIPNPNNFPEVNHLDENKTNNYVEDLEWCTREYNMNFGERNEKVRQKLSKRVKAVNVESGEVITFSSTLEAMNKGYGDGAVSKACRGVYKNSSGKLIGGDGHTYRGHKWSYIEEGA